MWLYSLPIVVLFVITMIANLTSQMTKNSYIKRYTSAFEKYIFISFSGVVSVIVLLAVGGIKSLSLFTVLLSCGFGIVTLLQSYFMLKAYNSGSFAYTSVIISLSTIIPAFSGAIFWKEKLYLIQIIGIVLLIACFFLCVGKDSEKRKISIKWLVYVIIAFLCTGLIGVMQKIHQSSKYAEELNGFLVISFAICTVSSLFCAIFAWRNEKNQNNTNEVTEKRKKNGWFYIPIILAGIGVALNNVINLYLSGKVDSAIFFPLVNGGGLILVTLSAVILYKEKLTVKQWIGIAVGIISVILLSNPFATNLI